MYLLKFVFSLPHPCCSLIGSGIQPSFAAQLFGDMPHKKPGNVLSDPIVHADLLFRHIFRAGEGVYSGLFKAAGLGKGSSHLGKRSQYFFRFFSSTKLVPNISPLISVPA